ncbi:hypothetical protein AAMO2058_001063200 [Amorphochlora amoebiformis]
MGEICTKCVPPSPEMWTPANEFNVQAHEGPVFFYPWVYYTTTPAKKKAPNVRIERLNVETGKMEIFRPESEANMPNGMIGEEPRDDIKTIFEESKAQPLNSPNDICIGPDGSLWFTDPSYGSLQKFRPSPPQAPNAIYRLDIKTKKLTMMIDLKYDEDEMHKKNKPNGICFSRDFNWLYYTNTSAAYPGEDYCECRHRSIWKIKMNEKGDGVIQSSHQLVCEINPPKRHLQSIPDGLKWVDGYLLTSCGPALVFVDPKTHKIVKRLRQNCAEVTNFSLSGCGKRLAVVANNKLIILHKKFSRSW